jgi:hypothetical protein
MTPAPTRCITPMRRREFIALAGGMAVWPLAGRAQQQAMPVIGYLSARTPEDSVELLAVFRRGPRRDRLRRAEARGRVRQAPRTYFWSPVVSQR